MSELILFSLKRRFFNKTTRIFWGLFFVIVLLLTFLDKLFFFFNVQTDAKLKVNVVNVEKLPDDYFLLDKNSPIVIEQVKDKFIVKSQHELSDQEKTIIQLGLDEAHLQQLSPTILSTIEKYQHAVVEFESTQKRTSYDNLFYVITTIYFMMLSYSGMLAGEIVAEKTSNILEMIATSISLKTHYYSKIVIGWLSILLQSFINGLIVVLAIGVRVLFDDGRGLIKLLKANRILMVSQDSVSEIVKSFVKQGDGLINLGLALLFLFMGMLLVQLILLMISTKIHTVEEAGALQSPFYILLILLYYVAIFSNNPTSLNSGFGLIASYIPIFSMIFMPCRLFIGVDLISVMIALVINLGALLVFIKWGELRYLVNILSFLPKKNKKNCKLI